MNNDTKEIAYLRNILDKVGAAKFEDNRKSLKTIEKTKMVSKVHRKKNIQKVLKSKYGF